MTGPDGKAAPVAIFETVDGEVQGEGALRPRRFSNEPAAAREVPRLLLAGHDY